MLYIFPATYPIREKKGQMFGGGRGMGGASGGSSMLRVVGRTVTRAGVTSLQEPLSSSSTGTVTSPTAPSSSTQRSNSLHNSLCLSSGYGSLYSPLSAHSGGPSSSYWPPFGAAASGCDDYEWVSVDGSDEVKSLDDFVLGPVPSVDEVSNAVSALTQVFDATPNSQFVRDKFTYSVDKDAADLTANPTGLLHVSSTGSDLDWMEPAPDLFNTRVVQPCGPDRVYDAFHLLQNDPSVQRMVISLSSDKAVWDAVLNNEVVCELRETYHADESITSSTPGSSDENDNPALNFVMWIFDNTKAKLVEIFEQITKLLNGLFEPHEKATTGGADSFGEALRTSLLLSIVVMLVVVVTRAHLA